MDVGGHFCPFALGLMIGFTEKNAKEEAETSLLNSPPLLLRGYIRMSLESPLPSSPTTLGSVTQPIPNGCCGPRVLAWPMGSYTENIRSTSSSPRCQAFLGLSSTTSVILPVADIERLWVRILGSKCPRSLKRVLHTGFHWFLVGSITTSTIPEE